MSSAYQDHELSPPPSPPRPGQQQIHPSRESPALSSDSGKRGGNSSPPLDSTNNNNGSDNESDDQESKLLNSKLGREPSALKTTLFFFIELIVVPLLMMLPAILLSFLVDFPYYDITKVKSEFADTNACMEFIRWSVFLSTCYSVYISLDWIIGTLPSLILSILDLPSDIPGHKFIGNQILYLRLIKFNLSMALFFLFVLFFGPYILYRSALLYGVADEKQAVAMAAKSSVSMVDVLKEVQSKITITLLIERSLMIVAILAIVLAIQKYFTERISISFHKSAFSKRIAELNIQYEVIAKMFHYAVNRNVTRVHERKASILELTRIVHDHFLNLSSVERCNHVGERIFDTFKDENNVITKASIQHLFTPETIDEAFDCLDDVEQGKITKEELLKNITNLYFERRYMTLSLEGSNKTLIKLDRCLQSVAIIIGLSISVPFFNATMGQIWATLGVLFTMFGFIFQAAGKTLFDSIFFVFIEHAFDVGDRVIIDEENLLVDTVNLMSTNFVRWDGLVVQISNGVLCNKTINNIRRSGYQSDIISLDLDAKTNTEQLHNFRNEIVRWIMAEEIKDYTGYVDITEVDVTADKMKLALQVQYRSNFQDVVQRNNRKTKLITKLREIADSLGIVYK